MKKAPKVLTKNPWLVIVSGFALLALAWSTALKGPLKLFAGVVGFGLILVNSKTVLAQLGGIGKQL
jgi:hypothetical protein